MQNALDRVAQRDPALPNKYNVEVCESTTGIASMLPPPVRTISDAVSRLPWALFHASGLPPAAI